MSTLTAQLLGVADGPRPTAWQRRFATIADRLVAAHGRPRLGNYRDPIREVLYIVLSARTADAQYRRTSRALFARFPTVEALAAAAEGDVLRCIAAGGLANKRAGQVKRIAEAVHAAGGRAFARALRAATPAVAFAALTALPGVGPKSALCVMMYSLDTDVFPVDVNVQRIAERLGAIPPGLSHHQAQRRLPALIPAGRSRELHVAMVAHGRAVCRPLNPRCGACSLRTLCPTGREASRE